MKKDFISLIFLTIVLANSLHGMRTMQTTRQILKPMPRSTPSLQKRIPYTKSYTQLSLKDTLKNYYNRFQQWLWGPELTRDQILKEANLITAKLEKKDLTGLHDFDYFLNEQKQEQVNIFLNRFVTTPDGLFMLNTYMHELLMRYIVRSPQAKDPFEKVTTWAEENLVKIFYTMPSLENKDLSKNFFLFTLLIPEHNIQSTLINNASAIIMTPNGRTFLRLLKQKDSGLYKIIFTRNPNLMLQLKSITAEEKSKNITKE